MSHGGLPMYRASAAFFTDKFGTNLPTGIWSDRRKVRHFTLFTKATWPLLVSEIRGKSTKLGRLTRGLFQFILALLKSVCWVIFPRGTGADHSEMSDVFLNFIAGGVGGSCTVIVGHPFDTVKVRIQTMPRPKPGEPPLYMGAMDCVKRTVAKEGFFALYKGMAAPLAGVSPLFAVFFAGCAIGKHLQTTHPDQEMTFIQNFNSGALAGVFTTIVMVPGERIKCLLQVQAEGHAQSGVHYNGPLDVVKKLYKQGGISSLYRGTGATLLRDIPASAAYLSVYEFLKKKFSGEGSQRTLSPGATLLAGGLAGIANWSVCIPADVLKSRLQTAPEGKYPDGIRGVFREVMREEGPKALFKGFTPVMLRAFPANAACFFGLEVTLSLFRLLGVGEKKPEAS